MDLKKENYSFYGIILLLIVVCIGMGIFAFQDKTGVIKVEVGENKFEFDIDEPVDKTQELELHLENLKRSSSELDEILKAQTKLTKVYRDEVNKLKYDNSQRISEGKDLLGKMFMVDKMSLEGKRELFTQVAIFIDQERSYNSQKIVDNLLKGILNNDISEKEKELILAQNALLQKDYTIDSLSSITNQLRQRISDQDYEKGELERQISSLERKMANVEDDLMATRMKNEGLFADNSELNQKQEKLLDDLQGLKQEKNQLSDQLNSVDNFTITESKFYPENVKLRKNGSYGKSFNKIVTSFTLSSNYSNAFNKSKITLLFTIPGKGKMTQTLTKVLDGRADKIMKFTIVENKTKDNIGNNIQFGDGTYSVEIVEGDDELSETNRRKLDFQVSRGLFK